MARVIQTGPTAQQLAAINAKTVSVVLSAGAGCGKTTVLTERFLSHLQPGPGPAELTSLVAITFTERAAREMRERIRARCLEQLKTAPPDQVDHWARVVREMDSARISTIHSFCASLLRSHAVEAGIDPNFGLLDEMLAGSFLQQSVRIGLHERLAADDPDVAELVFEFGLTRARELLALLVQARYRIDFHKWGEMTPRDLAQIWDSRWHTVVVPRLLRDLAESEPAQRTLELLTSFPCSNAVMQARCQALLEQLPRLSQADDPEGLLRSIRESAQVRGGGPKNDWENEDVYAEVQEAFASLRALIDKLLEQLEYDPEYLLRGAEVGLCALRATARIGTLYDERKARDGLVDFDDLLLRTRNLLRDRDDVRRRAQAGISLLMVDEFQDTDPIQDDIVRMLCGDRLLDGRLFVVGDAKQSIYRFRRAEPRVFHELRQKVPAAGRLPLSVNFRSQPQVLAFVNALFDGALGAEYEPLQAAAPQLAPPPCVEFLFSVEGGDEVSTTDDTDNSAPTRRRREGDWITARLTQLLADGVPRIRERDPQTGELRLREVQPRDIVILFRAMSDVRYYEEALRRRGLDYYVVGGRAFFAQQEVFDVVNLCQFLDDVDDEAALVGVLRSPFFSLADDAIFALGSHLARTLQVPRPLEAAGTLPFRVNSPAHLSEEDQARVRFAAETLAELHEEKDRLPIAQLLNLAIERTGYDAALLTEFLGARKLANLRKLIDMARQFDESGLFTLGDFVDRLRDAVADETHEPLAATHPESSNVIRLMSIHQSKGLEFPVVVIADMDRPMNSQLPPARFDIELGPLLSLPEKFGQKRRHPALLMHRRIEWDEDLAEGRRLLYVAATRAADLLILSANLKQAGKATSPWVKLLAERFDLLTGQPRAAPATGGTSILARYSGRLPEILVHHSPPKPMDLSQEAATHQPALSKFRAALDQVVPVPLPESVRVIPPDRSARRRFSVSDIESIDAGLRPQIPIAADQRSRDVRAGGSDEEISFSDLSASEKLGKLVHAALERIDFQAPQPLGELIDGCCRMSGAQVEPAMREAAVACVRNLLTAPLRTDLAAARQLHREIDFLLTFPLPGKGKPVPPPLHVRGVSEVEPTNSEVPVVISGTIDCLFESADGKWHVLDYKTGIRDQGSPPAELLAAYEIQLGLYALAVRELIGRLPDTVELVFVRQGVDRVIFEATYEVLNGVIERVNHATSHT